MTLTYVMLDLETWGKAPGCDLRSIGACVFDPLTGRVADNAETYGVMHDPEGITDGSFYIATDNPGISVAELEDKRLITGETGHPVIYPHWDGVDHYRKYPLTRDPSTVQWWRDQSAEAQAAFTNPVDLREALQEFDNWLYELCDIPCGDPRGPLPLDIRLWSHGPTFDASILAAAYAAVGLPIPWHYRAPRDTRTCFDMAGIDPGPDGAYRDFMSQYNTGTAHHALHDAIAQARCVCAAYAKAREPRECVAELEQKIQDMHDEMRVQEERRDL